MGGMAAQIPIKNDPAANSAALAKVGRGAGGWRLAGKGISICMLQCLPQVAQYPAYEAARALVGQRGCM